MCESVTKDYKLDVAKCRVLIRNYQIKKERQVIAANNAGAFYKFSNKRLSCKSGVGALRDANGNLVTDDRQRADMLNSFFVSVGSCDDGNVQLCRHVLKRENVLNQCNLTLPLSLQPSESSNQTYLLGQTIFHHCYITV